jgi:transcriptional regulator with XRE-family HTH domain
MTEKRYPLDVSELKHLRLRRGWTAKELSNVAGVQERVVDGLEGGRRDPAKLAVNDAVKLATALDAPQLVCREWARTAPETQILAPTASLADNLGNSVDSLATWRTYTRCVHTHFFCPEMRTWFQGLAFRALGWSDEEITEYAREHVPRNDENRMLHERHNFVHVILMREQIFMDAARTNPEWVAYAAHELRRLDGTTQVALAPRAAWKLARTLLRPTHCESHCSIEVFDEDMMLLRDRCGGPQMFVRGKAHVEEFAHWTEKAIGLVGSSPAATIRRLEAIALQRRSLC